ncbi:unnamed protein product [Oppiella nova]|uniref:Phosphatidic acid phosphatase type 2/haloperoxidase domain-containing protein n=1 Tax=Oppiella nova TaxID=334625 RepID=A0A7R9L9L8_9ACAR|nr:unnamed protein product [Oppiella nova]CAG2161027.1 unnamed protein product [Oppiella nova]
MVKIKKNLLDYVKTVDHNISLSIYRFGGKHIGAHWPSYQLTLRALEYSCHGIPWFAVAIISLYVVPNNKSVAQLLAGLLLDVICVAIMKATTRRRRPAYARQDDQLAVMGPDKHSLPSGHCSRATYVALFCGNHSLLSLLIWMWCLCVCASRLLLGRHHLLDAVIGVFLECLIIVHYLPHNVAEASILQHILHYIRGIFGLDPNHRLIMTPITVNTSTSKQKGYSETADEQQQQNIRKRNSGENEQFPSEEICKTTRQWEQVNTTHDLYDNKVEVVQEEELQQFVFSYRCTNLKGQCLGISPLYHSECTERNGWMYMYYKQANNKPPQWGYVSAPHHCACKLQPKFIPTVATEEN